MWPTLLYAALAIAICGWIFTSFRQRRKVHALERSKVHQTERGTRFAETLGRAGFEDLDAQATELSGGWQKRLAIVEALVQHPDILLGAGHLQDSLLITRPSPHTLADGSV